MDGETKMEELIKTDSLEEAQTIEFLEDKPEWGVRAGKQYEVVYGVMDNTVGEEYYIIDDLGRANVAVLLCLRSTLCK